MKQECCLASATHPASPAFIRQQSAKAPCNRFHLKSDGDSGKPTCHDKQFKAVSSGQASASPASEHLRPPTRQTPGRHASIRPTHCRCSLPHRTASPLRKAGRRPTHAAGCCPARRGKADAGSAAPGSSCPTAIRPEPHRWGSGRVQGLAARRSPCRAVPGRSGRGRKNRAERGKAGLQKFSQATRRPV